MIPTHFSLSQEQVSAVDDMLEYSSRYHPEQTHSTYYHDPFLKSFRPDVGNPDGSYIPDHETYEYRP